MELRVQGLAAKGMFDQERRPGRPSPPAIAPSKDEPAADQQFLAFQRQPVLLPGRPLIIGHLFHDLIVDSVLPPLP